MFRIACGPGIADDYNWTEEVMRIAGNYMNGLSLHYYTVPGAFEKKTAATGFDTNTYYETIRKALYMDELITRHTEIMSRYDPEHKVGLVVDEWGTWYDVEPGTNPGFLYQQNTMRDAIVAAVTLNIFNAHSDRVVMVANIAQLVNVLQSVILTEGEKMVLTPTYHVFDLYKHHHDATLLNSHLETEEVYAGVLNSIRFVYRRRKRRRAYHAREHFRRHRVPDRLYANRQEVQYGICTHFDKLHRRIQRLRPSRRRQDYGFRRADA